MALPKVFPVVRLFISNVTSFRQCMQASSHKEFLNSIAKVKYPTVNTNGARVKKQYTSPVKSKGPTDSSISFAEYYKCKCYKIGIIGEPTIV